MALIIDGYNLLHASGVLPRGVGPGTLERAREALLNFLAASLEPNEIAHTTVVFDAAAAPPGLPRAVEHQGLAVRYASAYESADALIEELIKADSTPRRLTIVSSDHRLHKAARRRKATAVDSEQWYAQIVRRRAERGLDPRGDGAAKPSGPLSPGEVARWLGRFGLAGDELPADQADAAADANAQIDEPNAKDTSPRSDKQRAAGLPADPRDADLENPFPPGYGDDLLEEES